MSATVTERERPPIAHRVVDTVWTALFAVLVAGPILYTLVAPRVFAAGPSPLGRADPGRALAVQGLVALATVLVAGGGILLAVPVRRAGRVAGPPLALAALGVVGLLSAVVHGSHAGRIGLLALPAVGGLLAVFPLPPRAWFEGRAVVALRVFAWGSLVAAFAFPAWAVQQGYPEGIAPFLTTRLAGLTSHANALGPLAVVLAVLEWRRRPGVHVPLLAALAVLVWTQSKTAWAAMAVLVAVLVLRRMRSRSPHRTFLPLLVFGALVGASAWIGLGLAAPERATSREDNDAASFTGRAAVWEVTLEVWRADPILGYGADLWDDAMDRRYANRVGFLPGHAHNQLIHSLGETGVVGGALVVVLLLGLGRAARRADIRSGGVSSALFLVLGIECFSEVPLRSVPFNVSFLVAFVLFAHPIVSLAEETSDA